MGDKIVTNNCMNKSEEMIGDVDNIIELKNNETEEDLLVEDMKEENSSENLEVCSLVEDECSPRDLDRQDNHEDSTNKEIKDPLSLSMFEKINKVDDRELDGSSEDEYDSSVCSEEDSDDDLNLYQTVRMSNPKMQILKTVGPDGEVKLTQIPPHIQVTRIPESREERMKREQELARRKEMAKKLNKGFEPSPIKRKHSERMTLKDVKRDDFEEAQDYLDFLQSKLQNISIKQCK